MMDRSFYKWNSKPTSVRPRLRRAVTLSALFGLLILGPSLGCTHSSPYLTSTPSGFAPGPVGANAMPPGQQYGAQLAELERRAKLLDDNNRQLTTQLAQSQQQMQLFKERSDLMQRQVQDLSGQLQQSRLANAQSTQQLRGLADQMQSVQASNQRRGSAKLTANTSARTDLEPLRQLGFPVDADNGVVRIRVPADQLFQPNSAQLVPSASRTIDSIAQALTTNFPKQRIAIEGHTDNAPIYGGSFTSSHQLAAAQSNAVLEYMTRRNQVSPSQFFTMAHAANYPLDDNQTPAGRANNRRIEFVIYNESF